MLIQGLFIREINIAATVAARAPQCLCCSWRCCCCYRCCRCASDVDAAMWQGILLRFLRPLGTLFCFRCLALVYTGKT